MTLPRSRRARWAKWIPGGGGVVDEHVPLPDGLEGARFPERHLPQIAAIAEAAEHEFGVPGGLCGGGGRRGAMLPDPGVGLGRRAIVEGELVPLRMWPANGLPMTPKPIQAAFAIARAARAHGDCKPRVFTAGGRERDSAPSQHR